MAAHIDKPTFTRADMVELIGAQLPIDAPGDPRALIEQIVDEVGLRVSAPREAHHREGNEKFTIDAIIAEEERILEMVDDSDNRARLDVRSQDFDDLSADQQRAIRNIAVSPYLVQPLQAPAGAGKTHSLKALRAAAHRARKEVLVLAPTGKAVDEAMTEGAGDRGLTVAKALNLIEDDRLNISPSTVVVVDEASMLGTPELKKLLACAVAGAGENGAGRRRLSALPRQGPRRHVRAALRRPAVEPTPRRGVADGRPRGARHLAGAAGRARQSAAHGDQVVPRQRTSALPAIRSRWPPTRSTPTSPTAPTERTRC